MDVSTLIKQEFVPVSKDEVLSKVISHLQKGKTVLVFDGNEFLGVVEWKFLLRSAINPSEAKITEWIKNIPTITEQTEIEEAAILMSGSSTRLLPVTKKNEIIGTIRALDVLNELIKREDIKTISIGNCKLLKSSVGADETISKALTMMFRNHIDRLPVVEKGNVDGVITEKDVLKKYHLLLPKGEFSLSNKSLSTKAFKGDIPSMKELPVSSFDTNTDIQTVQKSDRLGNVVRLMAAHGINSVIVEENGEFAGLLATKNILLKITGLLLPQDFNIRFTGLQKTHLKPYQTYNLYKLASQESAKLQRGVKNEFSLLLHVKEYSREGKKHKYAITMKLEYPGQLITSKQEDWDIETAVRKVFNNAKNAVKKKFKGDQSRRKGYE